MWARCYLPRSQDFAPLICDMLRFKKYNLISITAGKVGKQCTGNRKHKPMGRQYIFDIGTLLISLRINEFFSLVDVGNTFLTAVA